MRLYSGAADRQGERGRNPVPRNYGAAWGQGEQAALDKLVLRVHAELRRLAHRYMAGERPGHTLQTTASVNEVYLRLINARQVCWQNRAHFFAVSAQLIRRRRGAEGFRGWPRYGWRGRCGRLRRVRNDE